MGRGGPSPGADVAGVGPVPVPMWQRLVAAHGAHRLNPFAADFAQRRVPLGRKAQNRLTLSPDFGYTYQCLFAYVAWVMASPHALIGAILLQPISGASFCALKRQAAPQLRAGCPGVAHRHMYAHISDRCSAVRMPHSNRGHGRRRRPAGSLNPLPYVITSSWPTPQGARNA